MRWKFANPLFRRLWRRVFRYTTLLRGKDVEDLPDHLKSGVVYIVGDGEYLWFAAMICPCGCGVTLQMNLMPHSRPRWDVIKHKDGSVTLNPSVLRLTGCRSHFFLRRGQINWWHSR